MALEGKAPSPWLEGPSATVVYRSVRSCLWGFEGAPGPKPGRKFSRVGREEAHLHQAGGLSIQLPDLANKK